MKKQLTPARRTALLDLAARLGGGPVAVEVALAADDPEKYATRFASRLTAASVAPSDPELPWFALVEALRARKKLATLPGAHPPAEAVGSIHQLASRAGKKQLAPLLADPALPARATHEALQLAGGALAGAELALLHIERGDETYDVMVASAHEVTELRALARAAGQRITHLTHVSRGAVSRRSTRAR